VAQPFAGEGLAIFVPGKYGNAIITRISISIP